MNSMTDGQSDTSWRRECLLANVWLVFLAFPAITIVVDDLSLTRKIVAVVLLALFAVIHILAYLELIRRGYDLDAGRGMADEPVRDRSIQWFAALVTINVLAFMVASWPLLAVLPFIVSFAIFHFSWRVAGAVCATCLAVVLIFPALAGVLGQAWFFSVLVASVGGAAAMTRLNDESQGERAVLLTELALSGERDRVARDVHDVLGHSLTVVILKTQVCNSLIGRLDQLGADPMPEVNQDMHVTLEQTKAQLDEIESVSRRALAEIRSTVGGLRTADLADEVAAARVVLADAGVALTVRGDANAVPLQRRSVLAWVVREAVTNVIRHARATRCTIDFGPVEGAATEQVLVRISDDGIGLGSNPPGNGLTGLQERADADGVSLRVDSHHGTVIELVQLQPQISI